VKSCLHVPDRGSAVVAQPGPLLWQGSRAGGGGTGRSSGATRARQRLLQGKLIVRRSCGTDEARLGGPVAWDARGH